MAGLGAACLPWLHARKVAALGSDGASDVLPSGYAKLILPIHAVTIVAMGIHLLDNCMLDAVAEACVAKKRWTFMCVVAPLVLVRGTASPVNPLAIF
jgi:kynurenine formamidase